MTLASATKNIERLLLPSFCLVCKQETPEEPLALRWLCLNCHKQLKSSWSKTSLQPEINQAYYLWDYQKNYFARKIIQTLKYNLIKEVATIINIALETERTNLKSAFKEVEIIVPVPLHRLRLKERGFNQSRLIAQKIGEVIQKEIRDDILTRQIHKRPQAEIKKRAGREKNIKNIFKCVKAGEIRNKTILLVDDVATTGATLKEAALTLRRAGAKKILAFVLAQD